MHLARLLDAPASTVVELALLLPYALIFLATFQIADYVAYRDVFHADEALPGSVPIRPAEAWRIRAPAISRRRRGSSPAPARRCRGLRHR